jgi:hypothetical protein
MGGKLSLGPPSGGMIVAQPVGTRICEIRRIDRKNGKNIFIRTSFFIINLQT